MSLFSHSVLSHILFCSVRRVGVLCAYLLYFLIVFLKLCSQLLNGLRICKRFVYNPQIIVFQICLFFLHYNLCSGFAFYAQLLLCLSANRLYFETMYVL